jgi:hypothetical protein
MNLFRFFILGGIPVKLSFNLIHVGINYTKTLYILIIIDYYV